MYNYIVGIITVLPVILVGTYIYKKDRNKEPFKLLLKLFIGGILSTFLTLGVSTIITMFFPVFKDGYEPLNLFGKFIYALFFVASVEEISKWLFVYWFSYHHEDFDEVYDMIIYAVFVALGFAFFENIFYVLNGGLGTAIIRAITAVPGHAIFGIFMGYFLGLVKIASRNNDIRARNKNIALSMIIPIILHGVYNYLIFTKLDIALIPFFILVVLMYIFAIKRIKNSSNSNYRFKYNSNFCSTCGTKITSDFCPNCGRKNN